MDVHKEKALLMGYLDNELTEVEKQLVEEHLATCTECSAELEKFKKIQEITEPIEFVAPEDKLEMEYWKGYNKIERKIGWSVFSFGAIILVVYWLYSLIREIYFADDISTFIKIAIFTVIAGTLILLYSALRQKLFFRSRQRYKDVRR